MKTNFLFQANDYTGHRSHVRIICRSDSLLEGIKAYDKFSGVVLDGRIESKNLMMSVEVREKCVILFIFRTCISGCFRRIRVRTEQVIKTSHRREEVCENV